MYTGPNMTNDGVVFYYDTGNTRKSFKGEPTVNLSNNRTLEKNGSNEYLLYESIVGIFDTYGVGTYTVSFDIRTPVPGQINMYTMDGTGRKYIFQSQPINVTTEWVRHVKTIDVTLNDGASTVNNLSFYGTYGTGRIPYVRNVQIENKSYGTPFVDGTRLATESLLDLTGNNTIDVSNAGFDSDGLPTYNGTTNYSIINNNFVGTVTELTTSVWFRKNGEGSNYECALHKGTAASVGSSDYWTGVDLNNYLNATIGGSIAGQAAGLTTELIVYNKWYNLVATWNGAVVRVFINGVFNKQYNLTTYDNINFPTRIGASSDGANYQLNGDVPIVQIYNKHKTDLQVKQNFNALKSRFGII